MANFDASKEWVILFPPNAEAAKKAAGDLSRCIGLLAAAGSGSPKAPRLADAGGPAPDEAIPAIVLNSEGGGPERNGFTWRAAPERVEIFGESGRGLCNGIYSFLAALGLSWPAPGEEALPQKPADNSGIFALSSDGAYEPSRYAGQNPAEAPWRRFVPGGKKALARVLAKGEAFAAWAARRRYDALILPLAAFASAGAGRKIRELKNRAEEYGIALEAGGRDLSSLLPRRHFFLHRDFFRMEEGKRKKAHHFCPTSPGAIKLMRKAGKKLFSAAKGAKVFHLWPDKGVENLWCSCPSCRAFSPQEQNRIGVNAAADILAPINPDAAITFYEKPGEGGAVPLRRNLYKMERLPEGSFRSLGLRGGAE